MNIGLIGSQEDGWRIALWLKDAGQEILVYDHDRDLMNKASQHGFKTAPYLEEFAFTLESKRLIWIFIREEDAMDEILERLTMHLSVSDIIIAINPADVQKNTRRYEALQGFQIDLLDCSFQMTPDNRPTMLIGGNRFAFNYCEKMFQEIGVVQYCGRSGSSIMRTT